MKCHKCRKQIEDGASVWRVTQRGSFGAMLFRTLRLYCEPCFDEHYDRKPYPRQWFEDQGPRPCRHCRRPIYGWYENTGHCSEECRLQSEYKRRRQMRSFRRLIRPCGHCGEDYTPRRSDGLYCSGRCRVAALRAARKVSQAVSRPGGP